MGVQEKPCQGYYGAKCHTFCECLLFACSGKDSVRQTGVQSHAIEPTMIFMWNGLWPSLSDFHKRVTVESDPGMTCGIQ